MLTAAAFFARAATLPLGSLRDVAGRGGIVVVAPHPDDETLGCGGLISLAHAEGRAVKVIVLTDGCGSHPNSSTHPPDKLRDLREGETLRAAKELGLAPSAVAFLRPPDRALSSDDAEAENAVRAIVAAVEMTQASAIFATWGHDPHCDHQAAWGIAAKARRSVSRDVALVAYPIWGWSLPPSAELPNDPSGWRLAIESVASQKRRAIEAHQSQISTVVENHPPIIVLPGDVLERFSGPYEIYLQADP